ncbi:zinc metallochaperone AztD [Jonesia quinghaiensis]|uniref:zinc metallochaperone AztD n=1 Tax=Jonesia quinghaiensis TaxID=262806 RepID=UPI000567F166|nr:zinc metallochaperone AztD [Jonesia quinghaiensis]
MTTTRKTAKKPLSALALTMALSVVLASCADSSASENNDAQTPAETTETEPAQAQEASARTPRIAVTYEGGVKYLDALTLEEVGDTAAQGFIRLNQAGDNRHLFLSTGGGFELLDAGAWAQAHGDHAHYYTQTPASTGVVKEATTPGHAVVHDGLTALFDDGTGKVDVYESAHIAEGEEPVMTWQAPEAHHGVAVPRADGSLVVTIGTEEERTGVAIIAADGSTVTENTECPGVHGEAAAQDGRIVVGCQDGVLIIDGDTITKVESPDDYGRIGNQSGSPESPIVLGDYKSDPDADLERPTRISLINTETAELQLVDIPSSYTFRSLARDDDGNALVLGTDGAIHVIDPVKAKVTTSIPVIEAWEEPEEWQKPRPTIFFLDGMAYVTDPATNRVIIVDTVAGEVWKEATLEVTPNELNGITGGEPSHEGHDHGEEDHAEDDHADEEHGDDEHTDDEHAEDHEHDGHDH